MFLLHLVAIEPRNRVCHKGGEGGKDENGPTPSPRPRRRGDEQEGVGPLVKIGLPVVLLALVAIFLLVHFYSGSSDESRRDYAADSDDMSSDSDSDACTHH